MFTTRFASALLFCAAAPLAAACTHDTTTSVPVRTAPVAVESTPALPAPQAYVAPVAVPTTDRSGVDEDRTVRTTETVPSARGGGPALTAAMQHYAEALCDHGEACNEIGVGRHWRDRATCISDQRNDRSHAWEASHDCERNGLNTVQLDACLASIRADHCHNAFDALGRAEACRAGRVCGH